MNRYTSCVEARGTVRADVQTVFDYLDDHANLTSHMSSRSGMMLGSRMGIHMEADRTRRVGSRFGFTGSVLGLPLAAEAAVTTREPPLHKNWETISEPRLWVIGRYIMGFELTPRKRFSHLKVYIHYALPESGLPRLLGRLFARTYARWCTRRMVDDARAHFAARVPEMPAMRRNEAVGLTTTPLAAGPSGLRDSLTDARAAGQVRALPRASISVPHLGQV